MDGRQRRGWGKLRTLLGAAENATVKYIDHVCKEHTGFIGHKRQQHTENDASLGRPFPFKDVH